MKGRVLVIDPIKERWEDNSSWEVYNNVTNENRDSGLDLYLPREITVPGKAIGMKIPLGIRVSMLECKTKIRSYSAFTSTNTYFKWIPCALYPRSSTGARTPLRLSNSVGIIDACYRGEVIALVDNLADEPFTLKQGERYFQICRGDLQPFITELDGLDTDTGRGEDGLGSTGY